MASASSPASSGKAGSDSPAPAAAVAANGNGSGGTPQKLPPASAFDMPKPNLRGLNKPKCIQCGNVARSRCPFQCCKSCCYKAQNPCHIHERGSVLDSSIRSVARMDSRDWMYTSWRGKRDYDTDFIYKVDGFLKKAFELGQSKAVCPCSKCENKIYQTNLKMGQHICNNGFVANYTQWICHGEAHRARDEVVRQRIEEYDSDVGCGDMLHDFHQAHFDEGPSHVREDPPEPTARAYYAMLSSAQKPFHDHTDVSQLNAVGRLMALKSQLGIIGDDTVDTASSPTLSQIRARDPASGPAIRPRQTVAEQHVQQLQAQLAKETRLMQELEARQQANMARQQANMARQQADMARQQADMANLYDYIKGMHAQMGGSLPPPPTMSHPAPATPQNLSVASNASSHMSSTAQQLPFLTRVPPFDPPPQ